MGMFPRPSPLAAGSQPCPLPPPTPDPLSPSDNQSLWAGGRDQDVGPYATCQSHPHCHLPWFPVHHPAIGACGHGGGTERWSVHFIMTVELSFWSFCHYVAGLSLYRINIVRSFPLCQQLQCRNPLTCEILLILLNLFNNKSISGGIRFWHNM